ncbi:MAG: hypothetical protein ACOC56_01425, partial [Atribacterota bacterium]
MPYKKAKRKSRKARRKSKKTRKKAKSNISPVLKMLRKQIGEKNFMKVPETKLKAFEKGKIGLYAFDKYIK